MTDGSAIQIAPQYEGQLIRSLSPFFGGWFFVLWHGACWSLDQNDPIMKPSTTHFCRTLAVVLFLGSGAVSSAHPGAPGHYHPDEVDEFDQVAMVSATADEHRDLHLGGLLFLTALGVCIGCAFFKKDGGNWKPVKADR